MNIGDDMELGESRTTNMVLKMLGPDIRNEIDNYINDVCSRDFMVMNDIEQVRKIFDVSIEEFLSSLSEEELLDLRTYTGYNFKNINSILRGNWNYENNGVLTPEKKEEFRRISDSVKKVLGKFNMPQINFITFRGTTLDSFSGYGISELSQLESLEGKFLYDQGFTSTSILEDTCYYGKTLDDGRYCNVEIRYLIPAESNDGALLIDNNMSYAVGQNEFLLNSGALTKVIDVKIDKDTNTAILTAVLVPKKVYDMDYNKNLDGSKSK